MISILAIYSTVGAIAGVLAGLLGIGGGQVIVPMLVFCMARQGISDHAIMHLALGTSMASIMFTAFSSAWSHHKRGGVKWIVVRRVVAGILLGTFLGSFVAAQLSTGILKGIFVLFLYYIGVQLLTGKKPRPGRQLPGRGGMFGVGNVIGAVSSLVGIGGGALSVPFMVWCNVPLRQAIGTSAAIGLPIAVAGTAGYIYNGIGVQDLPAYTVGYVYLPALVGLIVTSVFTAPLGVRLAHSLPVDKLKRVFAGLLLVVGTRMLISIF